MDKIECWICGAPAVRARLPFSTYTDKEGIHARQYCVKCFEDEGRKHEELTKEYAIMKKRLMLERAIRSMESQNIDLYAYKDIIEQMEKYVIEYPEKFDSSQEMLCAILFVAEEIKAVPQKKIGKYRVDFYIPEYKIIFEVDGKLHSFRVPKDNERDREIRKALGPDWEVVRIPTKYIDTKAAQVIDAVFLIKQEKQEIRRKNSGIIPEWFNGSY